jgi:hypothetical protein
VAKIPVELPAFGVLKGNHVAVPLECTVRCQGTGTLELLTNVKGATPLIARFKFHLAVNKLTSVGVKLSKSTTKLFAHEPPVIVELVVTLKGKNAHGTYSATMTIAHKKAPAQHSTRT